MFCIILLVSLLPMYSKYVLQNLLVLKGIYNILSVINVLKKFDSYSSTCFWPNYMKEFYYKKPFIYELLFDVWI